jgi:uncharacterized iron-regulated membrane protein
MRMFFRKLHRWLGLLMAVQIIAWMASGLYFSLFPIELIRGEHLTREWPAPTSESLLRMGSPAAVKQTMDQHLGPGWELETLNMVSTGDQLHWRVEGRLDGQPFRRLLNEAGTTVVPVLSAEDVTQAAGSWLKEPADVAAVEWLESSGPGTEYRGRFYPAWKVSFNEPENLNLYLEPWTGEILARRTSRWRVFDFLWMLHIMDFDTRDDFNHPLLQAASFLGLIIALSGVIFWAMTTSLFRRKRPVVSRN